MQRANWLRVLQREAKVEQCDLFIAVRKSNELDTSGEYQEVMQLEPPPVSQMLSLSNCYEEIAGGNIARMLHVLLLFPFLIFLSNYNRIVGPVTNCRFGQRNFSCCVPKIWNGIPLSVRQSPPSLDRFKRNLKTHYFANN